VNLFDLLSKEIYLRGNRAAALGRHYDLKEFEQTLQHAIGVGRAEQVKLEASIETAESNISVINTKIEKKRQELERSEQRLSTMSKVRPAYMDEYEKIQTELEGAYLAYVTRFKVLCHLQHQMDEISRIDEARRAEEKLIKQDLENSEDVLLASGLRRLSGSDEDDEDESLLEDSVQQNARDFLISRAGSISKLQRPQGTAKNEMSLGGMLGRPNRLEEENMLLTDGLPGPSTGRTTARKPRQVVGSMFGLEDDDEEEDEETESESDIILLDGQNQGEHSDLGSDIDEEDLLMM
jgi:clusterin-associated protein 1